MGNRKEGATKNTSEFQNRNLTSGFNLMTYLGYPFIWLEAVNLVHLQGKQSAYSKPADKANDNDDNDRSR